FVEQLLHGDVPADMRVDPEGDAFLAHLRNAPVDVVLLQFEVRNPVAQQPAHAVGFFVNDHVVAHARKLLCGGQPGWTGPDYRYALAGLVLGRLRHHPTHLPRLVDDGVFDRLDADRVVIDVERTGRFA